MPITAKPDPDNRYHQLVKAALMALRHEAEVSLVRRLDANEFAGMIGISPSNYARIVRGDVPWPSFHTICMICETLGIEISEFFAKGEKLYDSEL